MHPPTIEEINKALDQANEEQLDFIETLSSLRESDSMAVRVADAYDMTYGEVIVISEWLKYIFLGLVPVTMAIDYIFAGTHSDERNILAYMSSLIVNTPETLRDLIKKLPFNSDLDKEYPGLFDGSESQPSKQGEVIANTSTGQILESLAKTGPENIPTRENVLSEIEDPTQTVKTPSFALPKSKPQTADILKVLAKPTNPNLESDPISLEPNLSTVIDPFLQNNSQNTVNEPILTDGPDQKEVVDILTKASSKPTISTETPASTPTDKILQNLDEKLITTKKGDSAESFKVVTNPPRHDPYREVPEV